MLYVSTNNKQQNYTASQALRLSAASDGGVIVPMMLPFYSRTELRNLCRGSFSQITSKLLSRFFTVNVSEADIELCLKPPLFIPDLIDRKTLLIKLPHNYYDSMSRIVRRIYFLLSGEKNDIPIWPDLAIRISLLFGLYGDLNRCGVKEFDFAVCADDSLALNAVWYAKIMGLPVGTVVSGCVCKDPVWELLRKGELSVYDAEIALLLHAYCTKETACYSCCESRKIYRLPEELCVQLNADIFTTVVSSTRRNEIIGNVFKTYGKKIDLSAAISYGALQDYRSVSGENRTTLLFSEDIN